MKRTIFITGVVFLLLVSMGMSLQSHLQLKTRVLIPRFHSARPNPLKLTTGGNWASVNVKGTNLQLIKGVRVLLNNAPYSGIQARLHRSWPRTKTMRFKARITVRSGSRVRYGIRLLDKRGKTLFNVPLNKFYITVKPPSVNLSKKSSKASLARPGSSTQGLSQLTPILTRLTLSPAMTEGGETIKARIYLSKSFNYPVRISLASSKSYLTEMPAILTIPTGKKRSRIFDIKTGRVMGEFKINITASYRHEKKTAELTLVGPPRLNKAEVKPGSICIGDSGTFTITTWSKAGKDIKIDLHRGSSLFTLTNTTPKTVGETIILPYGKKTVSATVKTAGTMNHGISTSIRVKLGQDEKWAEFSIHPPGVLNKISFGPVIDAKGDEAFLFSGSSFNGYIYLNHYAGSGGVSVNLSSSHPAVATIPASVTVQKGKLRGDFTITHKRVTTDTIITITATQGSISKSRSILLKPRS